MTKSSFITALRTAIEAKNYPWAARPGAIDAMMGEVSVTLHSKRNTVAIDGPSFIEAWRAIGGKGKPTYKALRALPAV